jgi:hypothetical protein
MVYVTQKLLLNVPFLHCNSDLLYLLKLQNCLKMSYLTLKQSDFRQLKAKKQDMCTDREETILFKLQKL